MVPWKKEWNEVYRILGWSGDLARLINCDDYILTGAFSIESEIEFEHACRLDFLRGIVVCLKSSYNDFGIKRWFNRKRTFLNGKTPADILSGNWQPSDPGPQAILDDACSLLSS